MNQIIRDYGTIISPTVAFLLGIITLQIKNWIDNKVQRKRIDESFEKAKEMLSRIQLPEYSMRAGKGGILGINAAQAMNLTNISRMYFLLSAAYKYLLSLENGINQSQNPSHINQYFYLVWRIEKLITELEIIRENSDVDMREWRELQRQIPELLEFINDDWFLFDNKKKLKRK